MNMQATTFAHPTTGTRWTKAKARKTVNGQLIEAEVTVKPLRLSEPTSAMEQRAYQEAEALLRRKIRDYENR